jgi:hepatitis B virus X-interacting protein
MEGHLETQVAEIAQTPGVLGAICTDSQGLSLAARGTLKPQSAGVIAGLVSQANNLKMGTSDDDRPTIVVEFDTGNIMIKGQSNSTLAIHKV